VFILETLQANGSIRRCLSCLVIILSGARVRVRVRVSRVRVRARARVRVRLRVKFMIFFRCFDRITWSRNIAFVQCAVLSCHDLCLCLVFQAIHETRSCASGGICLCRVLSCFVLYSVVLSCGCLILCCVLVVCCVALSRAVLSCVVSCDAVLSCLVLF
jgi:hypothetical protein